MVHHGDGVVIIGAIITIIIILSIIHIADIIGMAAHPIVTIDTMVAEIVLMREDRHVLLH